MGVDMGSVQTKMEVPNGGQATPRSKPQACKVSTLTIGKLHLGDYSF